MSDPFKKPILCKYKDICSIKAEQKTFADVINSILENFCMSNYTRCARFKIFKAKGNSEEAQKILPKELEKASKAIEKIKTTEKKKTVKKKSKKKATKKKKSKKK